MATKEMVMDSSPQCPLCGNQSSNCFCALVYETHIEVWDAVTGTWMKVESREGSDDWAVPFLSDLKSIDARDGGMRHYRIMSSEIREVS